MNIYVINLEGSQSRWDKVTVNLDDIGARYTRIPAIYGRSIDWRARCDDAYCRSYMGRSLQPGEVGCFLSHVKALQAFLDSGAEYTIVLEDDAQCSEDLLEVAQQVVAHLGQAGFLAVNLGPSDYKYATLVQAWERRRLFCAHRFPMLATGILWSRIGATEFMRSFDTVKLPYDNYLRVFLSGTNRAYSVEPPVVRAAETDSDIDLESLTKKRSALNRSKLYFLLKQRRMLGEKYRSLRALLRFRLSGTRPQH